LGEIQSEEAFLIPQSVNNRNWQKKNKLVGRWADGAGAAAFTALYTPPHLMSIHRKAHLDVTY
jgi:hypothetical protein